MPPPTIADTVITTPEHERADIRLTGRFRRFRQFLAFAGPGYLVAVGYLDPGNWATDLAGGSRFGYSLLWVVMLSNLIAMLLQVMSARLGIVTGMDLAQACRRRYSRPVAIGQWLLCETAICATDLAEVIGSAIALSLLFGIPLLWGVVLTAGDALLILWLQQRRMRYLESLIIGLLTLILLCVAANLVLAHPEWHAVAAGMVPDARTFTDPARLYIAIGIIGATVMPHNLYLHSSIVKSRHIEPTPSGRRGAMRLSAIDTVVALLFAFAVNAAILIMASAAFHRSGHQDVSEIQEAYRLLTPLLGTSAAGLMFGLALLAAGQSSTLTATLAGQIVMEGYVDLKLPAWSRRLLTRSIAILPALFVTAYRGESGVAGLLVFSQVVLSLQLPFAVVPLIRLTSDPAIMGEHVNPAWMTRAAWCMAAVVILMNGMLLYGMFV